MEFKARGKSAKRKRARSRQHESEWPAIQSPKEVEDQREQ
jgi:hypothetical protein